MSKKIFTQKRDEYIISSDPSLLDLAAINAAFAGPSMYWCTALSESDLRTTLENSLNLGLYVSTSSSTSPAPAHATPPKPKQIGLARLITDYVTFAYLTDVYVLEEAQGKGLGLWLIDCVGEVLKGMPHLRRAVLVTGEGEKERFYEKKLGFRRADPGSDGVITMHYSGPDAVQNLKRRGQEEEKGKDH